MVAVATLRDKSIKLFRYLTARDASPPLSQPCQDSDMTRSRTIASIAAALAATMLISAPVAAQRGPHHGKKHGKRVKICRWVRR